MIKQMEERIAGVVCLHCGLRTYVSNSSSFGRSGQAESRPQVSIIRCSECGGEAPYLADEIVMMKRVSNVVSCAA